MSTLNQQEIDTHLEALEGWEYDDNAIHASYEFENFKECFTFMTRVAFEAEELQHHPDWSNVYNELHITLSTHDEGGVTEKDFNLAKRIERLFSED